MKNCVRSFGSGLVFLAAARHLLICPSELADPCHATFGPVMLMRGKDEFGSGVNAHCGLFLVAICWHQGPSRGEEHASRILRRECNHEERSAAGH
jgi:hypothetical protein